MPRGTGGSLRSVFLKRILCIKAQFAGWSPRFQASHRSPAGDACVAIDRISRASIYDFVLLSEDNRQDQYLSGGKKGDEESSGEALQP